MVRNRVTTMDVQVWEDKYGYDKKAMGVWESTKINSRGEPRKANFMSGMSPIGDSVRTDGLNAYCVNFRPSLKIDGTKISWALSNDCVDEHGIETDEVVMRLILKMCSKPGCRDWNKRTSARQDARGFYAVGNKNFLSAIEIANPDNKTTLSTQRGQKRSHDGTVVDTPNGNKDAWKYSCESINNVRGLSSARGSKSGHIRITPVYADLNDATSLHFNIKFRGFSRDWWLAMDDGKVWGKSGTIKMEDSGGAGRSLVKGKNSLLDDIETSWTDVILPWLVEKNALIYRTQN